MKMKHLTPYFRESPSQAGIRRALSRLGIHKCSLPAYLWLRLRGDPDSTPSNNNSISNGLLMSVLQRRSVKMASHKRMPVARANKTIGAARS